jgi:GT2 family glycosyltransferase
VTTAARFSIILVGADDPVGAVATRASIDRQRYLDREVIECNSNADPASQRARAIERARGEFLVFVDAGDVLHPDALARIAEVANDSIDLVYTDEDTLDGGSHRDPFFKPDWSPDRLRAQHYTGRLAAYRRNVVIEVGGVRSDMLDAYEHDLVLRLAERASKVAHVPYPLYHRAPGSRSFLEASEAGRRAIAAHLARTGAQLSVGLDTERNTYRLRPALREQPLVSIVIPTAGTSRNVSGQNIDLVVKCVTSVVERSTYENYEIVCVADGSTPTHVVDAIRSTAGDRLKLVRYDLPFNFSHKINTGVLRSRGEYLVLLNDDTEVQTRDWMEVLLGHATDPGVGAVGLMLHFPGGRIQHAGVIASGGNPGHPYYGYGTATRGYFDNLLVPCNYLAVTAACLMTSRACFDRVGGFSLQFPSNYNDIDYGIKLHRSGYRIVFTPEATFLHHESASRGAQSIADGALALLWQRWGRLLRRDPFYNPNFIPGADFLTVVAPDGRTAPELGYPTAG